VVHLGIAQDTQVPVDDSVSTVKIQDDAVSTVKIQDDAVTSAKLANSLNITSGNSITIDSGATITNNGTASGFGSAAYAANASASTGAVNVDASDNLQFNSGYGSTATAYGCRVWIRFNGSGTVSIIGSANVSSLVDNGIGLYTVNFTNAIVDTTYSALASLITGSGRADAFPSSIQTGLIGIKVLSSAVLVDGNNISVAIFR
jgi:hypothetical protein